MSSVRSTAQLRLTASEFADAVLSMQPAVAVFDCDGTLWSGDAGYDFMLWSMEEGLVSRNASDWIDSRYRLYRAGQVSEEAMCGEMVQIYDGLREDEVRNAATVFVRTRVKDRIFPEMLSLVEALRERGAEIWAVSSTNHWVIEEGVRDFRIAPDRVLAARVEVVKGNITSRLIEVPTDEGKARALARVGRPHPDVVFGNSIHDAAMLRSARRAFPVNPTPALIEIATEARWPIFFPETVLNRPTP